MASIVYCALGDSTGVGIGAHDGRGYVHRLFARIQARDPSAKLHNACVNGATSSAVAATQLRRACALTPTLASLFVGGNDVWRGVPEAAFARNVDGIVAALADTGARVLVGTVPNLSHAPAAAFAEVALGLTRATIGARIGAFNDAIRRAASRHGARLVDLHAFALEDAPHFFCGDGFHPSSEGYAAWDEVLWPHAERALFGSAA